jgi:hypothetical protein
MIRIARLYPLLFSKALSCLLPHAQEELGVVPGGHHHHHMEEEHAVRTQSIPNPDSQQYSTAFNSPLVTKALEQDKRRDAIIGEDYMLWRKEVSFL